MAIQTQLRKIKYNAKETASLVLSKNAFVFGEPFHSNAGDQAQSYCIQKWIINSNHRLYKKVRGKISSIKRRVIK